MSNIAWIDRQYKSYKMKDIKDSHLKNILGFMCKGGGYADFLDEKKINTLFQEAVNRGIKHQYSLDKALKAFDAKWLNQAYNDIMREEQW